MIMTNTINTSLSNIGDRTNILGVGVSQINMKLCLEKINHWILTNERQYVCVANVHTIMESTRDKRLRMVNNNAGMVTPDGMPLVWVNHWMGNKVVTRVYGPDLLFAACERSLETGWSHFFYGGTEEVVQNLTKNIYQRFPGIKIVGYSSPPFRKLTSSEDDFDVNRINTSGADILWIGLGAPKQEYWMAEHLGRIKAPVMVGVGAAFDFHAGVKKQAPLWMQRSGLEWLFRLVSEPKRLWKRYLYNNPLFIWSVFLQLSGLKKFPLN
jgi:N-acetylglucosaminyldiphosphoundecaprenol N-acetyl-beta-D-mannosaminyltransferase